MTSRLSEALVFSKFNKKQDFGRFRLLVRIGIKLLLLTTPFSHYEWNVMPFRLKNVPSEFQNIMNDILNHFSHFTIVYKDDVLIFSKSIDEHWKHSNSFLGIIKHSRLVVYAIKINSSKPRLDSLVLIFLKD
jgi:hypothetical protein